jgi:hypothetical protein
MSMATLHVQDVPDDLYASLLRQAQTRGCSLDEVVVELLKMTERN